MRLGYNVYLLMVLIIMKELDSLRYLLLL